MEQFLPFIGLIVLLLFLLFMFIGESMHNN